MKAAGWKYNTTSTRWQGMLLQHAIVNSPEHEQLSPCSRNSCCSGEAAAVSMKALLKTPVIPTWIHEERVRRYTMTTMMSKQSRQSGNE